MTTTLLVHPRPATSALIAWQFLGQPLHEWPTWVQNCCTLQRSEDGKLELRHDRRSGTQIVYLDGMASERSRRRCVFLHRRGIPSRVRAAPRLTDIVITRDIAMPSDSAVFPSL